MKKIIWRVETNKTKPDKLPYENMSISKDKSKIYATDFYSGAKYNRYRNRKYCSY